MATTPKNSQLHQQCGSEHFFCVVKYDENIQLVCNISILSPPSYTLTLRRPFEDHLVLTANKLKSEPVHCA